VITRSGLSRQLLGGHTRNDPDPVGQVNVRMKLPS
jgi:hypothetical protein